MKLTDSSNYVYNKQESKMKKTGVDCLCVPHQERDCADVSDNQTPTACCEITGTFPTGVFPLEGKLKNVEGSHVCTISEPAEYPRKSEVTGATTDTDYCECASGKDYGFLWTLKIDGGAAAGEEQKTNTAGNPIKAR